MGYRLGRNNELEKKCNWKNVSMLRKLDLLTHAPHILLWGPIHPGWKGGPADAALLGLASPSFQDPWKSCFLLLFISLCSWLPGILRKPKHLNLHQKRERLVVCFSSCANFPSHSLCVFPSMGWESLMVFSICKICSSSLIIMFIYFFILGCFFSVLSQASLTSQPQIYRNAA